MVVVLVLARGTPCAGCPVHVGAGTAKLEALDDQTRLAWIQSRLARTSRRSRIWTQGWTIGIIGATAIDLALIPILGDTRDHRIDFGLGAATTIVGIVPILLWPPRVIDDHRALDARIAKGDTCGSLQEAERLLVADARTQRRQRAWFVHAGNVVLNGGVTLLFGAFHHWGSGILNGVGGALVGEAIILTQPADQIDDLDRYRRGDLDEATSWQLVPTVTERHLGVALTREF
ncbi:MAG: hypothetical protein ABI467_03480 [Kofleriaceae bacterium]